VDSVLSLKAETHNFPTTVEPFNGASTGTGGEIRDRLAGGKGSIPVAGTAVYMTAYPRLEEGRSWEQVMPPTTLALPDTGTNTHQSLQWGIRFWQQIRTAADLRFRTHL